MTEVFVPIAFFFGVLVGLEWGFHVYKRRVRDAERAADLARREAQGYRDAFVKGELRWVIK